MENILAAIKNIQEPGSFCSKRAGSFDNFNLEIKKFGSLTFPLKVKDAKALIKTAKPAKFGFREKTLLDKNVRDAWEISKTNIKIGNAHWHREFKDMLDLLKKDLGLDENTKLKASLHNLLIYEPGQFFNYHQDSEKLEGMVATLIIVLPSVHKGGTLIIDNHGDKKQFHSSRFSLDKLSYIAFYADCHHKITKLTEGYRCVLTYNLTLDANTNIHRLNTQKSDDKLTQSLREYFINAQNVKANAPKLSFPTKFVYLLDHSYTEKGLSWRLLKNSDALRAKALKNAADALGLEIYMALADIQETWDCEGDYDFYYSRRGRYRNYQNQEENQVVTDLIDSCTVLKHWIDRDNNPLHYKECTVSNKELHWTKANNELKPFQSEYEGFMGNYGNTLERWYHRAAIILWQKNDHHAILFKIDAGSLLSVLLKMAQKKTNVKEVSSIITSLLPYWSKRIQKNGQPKNYLAVFELALYVQDPSLAKSMLIDFNLAVLTPEIADLFLRLQDAYGTSWCFSILQKWAKYKDDWSAHSKCQNIFEIIKRLGTHPDHQTLTLLLLSDHLEKFKEEALFSKKNDSRTTLFDGVSKRMEEITNFIKACIIVNNHAIYTELLKHLFENLDLYPAIELVNTIDFIKKHLAVGQLEQWHYQKLFNYIYNELENEMKRGLRRADDWSINEENSCKCEDCAILGDFLKSKTLNTFTWPLGKDRRNHIHNVLNGLRVAVSHRTDHTGSPHKLILKKTAKLHQEAALRFDRLKKSLKHLSTLGKLRSIDTGTFQ